MDYIKHVKHLFEPFAGSEIFKDPDFPAWVKGHQLASGLGGWFGHQPGSFFWFCFGATPSDTQEFTPGSVVKDYFWWGCENHKDAKDYNWVGCVQSKCPPYCTLTLAALSLLLSHAAVLVLLVALLVSFNLCSLASIFGNLGSVTLCSLDPYLGTWLLVSVTSSL